MSDLQRQKPTSSLYLSKSYHGNHCDNCRIILGPKHIMTSPVELRTSISLSYNICDVLEKGEEGKELLQHKART